MIFLSCCLIRDTKLRNFQYKFIHRILATNYFLHRINIVDSSSCTFCGESEETLDHIFWRCSKVGDIWDKMYLEIFHSKVKIEYENVCFGYPSDKSLKWFSLAIFYAKQYIYKCRMNMKPPSYDTFKYKLNFLMKVEIYILTKSKRYDEVKLLRECLHC